MLDRQNNLLEQNNDIMKKIGYELLCLRKAYYAITYMSNSYATFGDRADRAHIDSKMTS